MHALMVVIHMLQVDDLQACCFCSLPAAIPSIAGIKVELEVQRRTKRHDLHRHTCMHEEPQNEHDRSMRKDDAAALWCILIKFGKCAFVAYRLDRPLI